MKPRPKSMYGKGEGGRIGKKVKNRKLRSIKKSESYVIETDEKFENSKQNYSPSNLRSSFKPYENSIKETKEIDFEPRKIRSKTRLVSA